MKKDKTMIVAIQLSYTLRKRFKTLCAINDITMKDAVVEEIKSIIQKDEALYRAPTPKEEQCCNLMFNIPTDLLEVIGIYKDTKDDLKIRDLYITAIINYIFKYDSDFDISNDIE